MGNKRTVFIFVIASMILAILFNWLMGGKGKNQTMPTPTQNQTNFGESGYPQLDPLEEERNALEQKKEQDKKEIKGFITKFLTKYLEYNPKKPTAHIESVKTDLDPSIFQSEFTIYKTPIPDWQDRKLKKIHNLSIIPKDKGYYQVEAVAETELTTTKGTFPLFISFSFQVKKEETGWKIKTLYYHSGDGEE